MSDNHELANRTAAKNAAIDVRRRRLLKASLTTATVTSSGFAGLSTARSANEDWNDRSLRGQLEVVRRATNAYKRLDEMADAGYVSASLPLLCGVGYVFDNPDLWDGSIDPENPESLFYVLNEGGRLTLAGVEFVVVAPRDDGPPNLFNDEGEELEGDLLGGNSEEDGWIYLPDVGVWVLHVWVHERNPDGVFSGHNPRYGSMPGCGSL